MREIAEYFGNTEENIDLIRKAKVKLATKYFLEK